MKQLRTIPFLTFGYFGTILLEIFFNSSIESFSSKITLLEHIQSFLTLTILRDVIILGLIIFVLLVGLLMINDEIFIIYAILLKFFELIPLLIDLINLLFIYQYKINNIHNRFYFSFILIIIRFIFNLDVIRRKYDDQWKKRIIIIFDLLIFILININLLQDSNRNLFRIGRKIILGLLIFHLNNLFCNQTFWVTFIKRNDHLKDLRHADTMNILHGILYLRWILSSFIIYLFIFFTFQSIIIDQHGSLFSIKHVHISVFVICISTLYVIHWDTLQNRHTLDQYGISRFSTGLDLLSTTEPITKKIYKTCSVCCNDKELSKYNVQITTACQHRNRPICDICLFRHVQQAIQITFTDDIDCPELECRVKFDYNTVRNILLLDGDNQLIERYDRYVLHRELEQMEEFIWCSNSSCNVGQLNEGGILNNIVICFNCRQKTCFNHKVQWHEGKTCAEYDMTIDRNYESSRRWIVENSKKCPRCPYHIEKTDGCDHITCIKCRHEFCWSCLADFQPIRQDGNHRHNVTCKHYAAYDGE